MKKKKIDGTAIFFTILFIVAGIGLICGTLSAKRNYERDFVRVEAVVIGNWEREPEDPFGDDWLYYAIFEYEYEGERYTVRDDTGASAPLYPVGEKVPLLINPYSPKEFKTDQGFFVFLAVGWFLILFAMMLLTFVVLPSFFRNFFEKLFGQLLRVVTVGSFFVLWLIFYAGAHPTLTVRELFREPFFLISFALGCAIVIMMGYEIVYHQIKRKKSPSQSALEPIAMMGEENSPTQDWVSEINAIWSISGSVNGRTGEDAGGVSNAGASGDLGSVRPRTEAPSVPSADAMGEDIMSGRSSSEK